MKAIAFCGFGTPRSWQISTVSMRLSPRSCAASPPPPKPSPIKGEGFYGANDGAADSAAGAVVRADAVLHPRGLAAGRAQAEGVARSLHGGCPLLYAAPQERHPSRVAPRADPDRRSGDPRVRQALSRDAGGPAR